MNSKIFFHWIKYVISLQTLTKADAFDKSLTKRTRITTTTNKSLLRSRQRSLAVKNLQNLYKFLLHNNRLLTLYSKAPDVDFKEHKKPFAPPEAKN